MKANRGAQSSTGLMNEKRFIGFVLLLGTLMFAASGAGAVSIGKPAPDVAGQSWINSRPLTIDALKGRVIMVEFWTYG
jgi:hypothetical protein